MDTTPSGGSCGSAAAVVAYDWLDIAIGIDTPGSGRLAALANGVFEFRPSHDHVCLEGMASTSLSWNTPCLYARDINSIRATALCWHTTKPNPREQFELAPEYVVYEDDYIGKHQAMFDSFVEDLQSCLGIQCERPSMLSLWNRARPSEAGYESLHTFCGYRSGVVENTYFREFNKSTAKFRAKYKVKYNKDPCVNQLVTTDGGSERWYQTRTMMRRLQIFKTCSLKHICKCRSRMPSLCFLCQMLSLTIVIRRRRDLSVQRYMIETSCAHSWVVQKSQYPLLRFPTAPESVAVKSSCLCQLVLSDPRALILLCWILCRVFGKTRGGQREFPLALEHLVREASTGVAVRTKLRWRRTGSTSRRRRESVEIGATELVSKRTRGGGGHPDANEDDHENCDQLELLGGAINSFLAETQSAQTSDPPPPHLVERREGSKTKARAKRFFGRW